MATRDFKIRNGLVVQGDLTLGGNTYSRLLDSDEVINIINDNVTGLADSDLAVVATLREDVDSDSAKIQELDTTLGTLSTKVDSIEAGLDSETARIQLLLLSTDSDALSIAGLKTEADSDAAAIAELLRQADSDATAIQALRTDFDTDITTIKARLDSDEIQIQAIQTDLETAESNITTIQTDITTIEAKLDSDSTVVQSNTSRLEVAEARLDSDSIKIQLMQGAIESLEAGTYNDAPLIARLDSDTSAISALRRDADSDSTKIQAIQTQLDDLDTGDITALRADADSDSIAIQAIRTSVDSDYELFNAKIAAFNGLTDSDLTTVSNLRNDVDSDSVKIQALQGTVDNLNSLSREDSDIINKITGAQLIDTNQIIGGSVTDVDSFLANDIRAAKYVVVMSSDSDKAYQADEMLVVHDGTNAYVTQYAQIATDDSELATFDATYTAGSVYLQATPTKNNVRFDAQRLHVSVANDSIIILGVNDLRIDSDDSGTGAASFGSETRFSTAISRDPSNGGTNADVMTTRIAANLDAALDNADQNTGDLEYGHFVFYNNGSPVYDFCANGIFNVFDGSVIRPATISVNASNNSTQSTFRVSFPTNLVFSPQFEGVTYNPGQWSAANNGNTQFDEVRLYVNDNTTGVTEANSTLILSKTITDLTAP